MSWFSVRVAIWSVCIVCLSAPAQVLAKTPPMGWNSWNHFGRNVTDADVRSAADAIVAKGLRDAGYVYVNIDDSWEGERDAAGFIHSNAKFPDMKALGAYLHSKGLKFGIYSSPGAKTCAGFEGSLGHEWEDARTYGEWGVDYLKYDLCTYREVLQREAKNDAAKQLKMMQSAYDRMHQALLASGRPIVFSLCQYGMGEVWQWGAQVGGNAWRTTIDIHDSYLSMSMIGFSQVGLSRYARAGHWNDPDMLEVGNGGMTGDEYRTHISLWALLGAPLLMGNDLSKVDASTLSLLKNDGVIAIDQDEATAQGDRVWARGDSEIWAKRLGKGVVAVGLFNRGEEAQKMTLHLEDLDMAPKVRGENVWTREDLGVITRSYTALVPRHGVVLLRLAR